MNPRRVRPSRPMSSARREQTWPTQQRLMVVIGICVVFAALAAIGAATTRSQSSESIIPTVPAPIATDVRAPVSEPTVAIATATPLPTATPCSSGGPYLQVIVEHERLGRWAHAADTADLALQQPDLCPQVRSALAAKLISTGLEALLDQSAFDPLDSAAERELLDRYHTLQVKAQALATPFPSALQIARRAYRAGLFYLAQAAFQESFAAGEFQTSDLDLVRQYTSTLHNLGYWRATKGNGELRESGLRLLATAHRLDVRYRLGSGESAGVLRELLGPDEHAWPAPDPSPLLEP